MVQLMDKQSTLKPIMLSRRLSKDKNFKEKVMN